MKYIRTKQGEIHEFLEEGINNAIISKTGCVIMKYSIIKQAKTIEELCDEWVLPPQRDKPTYDTLNAKLFDFNSLKSYWAKEQKIIYGAIWTNKGLIYVAKMNSKGELEIL